MSISLHLSSTAINRLVMAVFALPIKYLVHYNKALAEALLCYSIIITKYWLANQNQGVAQSHECIGSR